MDNLRYALRTLFTKPGFTAVAVITLALGIGANSTIFTVVHGVLLKPLPYPDPERLVMIWQKHLETPAADGQTTVDPADYLD